MNILIVDDSSSMARAMESLVEQAGHTAMKAEDGYVALRMYREHKPGFIFMDVDMPRLDGYKTTKIIRSLGSVPIYFLTSNNTIFDAARAKLVGGTGFIAKPFDKHKILSVLAAHT